MKRKLPKCIKCDIIALPSPDRSFNNSNLNLYFDSCVATNKNIDILNMAPAPAPSQRVATFLAK